MVKRLSASLVFAVFVGGFCIQGTLSAQTRPGASAASKIGLVDMAEVFKQYKKFEVMREDLKAKIEKSDATAKGYVADMSRLNKVMQGLKEGSTDYAQREKELITLKSQFEAYRAGVQRDLMREESEIYKTIYLEVTDMVDRLAKANGYSLVLRFTRTPLEEAEDPSAIIQRMNQQVIVYEEENDLTNDVIHWLNKRYQPKTGVTPVGGTSTRGATRRAGGTRRGNQ